MIVRGLDSDNDWTFGSGKQNYLTDIDALKQNIVTRLKSWKGNCFFDITAGVDWNNYLDIGTKSLLDMDIKRVILQSTGVLKIVDYSSTLDTDERNLTVSVTVQSIYGTTEITETV